MSITDATSSGVINAGCMRRPGAPSVHDTQSWRFVVVQHAVIKEGMS